MHQKSVTDAIRAGGARSTCGSVLVAYGARNVAALRDSGIRGKLIHLKDANA